MNTETDDQQPTSTPTNPYHTGPFYMEDPNEPPVPPQSPMTGHEIMMAGARFSGYRGERKRYYQK